MNHETMTIEELNARRKVLIAALEDARAEIKVINALLSRKEAEEQMKSMYDGLTEEEINALQNIMRMQSVGVSGIDSEAKLGEPGK